VTGIKVAMSQMDMKAMLIHWSGSVRVEMGALVLFEFFLSMSNRRRPSHKEAMTDRTVHPT
jgi:hypothetical protein